MFALTIFAIIRAMTIRAGQPVRPYYRKVINAGSAVAIAYQSIDDSMDPVELSALRYRIDDLTNRVAILDWTSVSEPAQKGTVTVPASLNGMQSSYRDRELRQVIFELTDTSGNITQQLAYYVLANVFQGAA